MNTQPSKPASHAGATARPWEVRKRTINGVTRFLIAEKNAIDGGTICQDDRWYDADEQEAAFALIVEAVNSFDAACALAEIVLAVDASGKRDIPERVCKLAREFEAARKGEQNVSTLHRT